MMKGQHQYKLSVKWTGNKGSGTSGYTAYERSHAIIIDHKPVILGSSDPAFMGDETKHNPEEMLLASLSSCHMLWYLHLCSEAKVVVTAYEDHASGLMELTADGGGKFTEVILNPVVTLSEPAMKLKAIELHKRANELCFIARSVNFPVRHVSTFII